VRWHSFSVEFEERCGYDWVKVVDDADSLMGADKLCGCSWSLPEPFNAAGNALVAKFHTDGSVRREGFVAEVISCPVGQFHDGIQCQTCTAVDRASCEASGLHFRECTPAHDAECLNAPNAPRETDKCWKFDSDGSNYGSLGGSNYDGSLGDFDGPDRVDEEYGEYGSLYGSGADDSCDDDVHVPAGGSYLFASGFYDNDLNCVHQYTTGEGAKLSVRWHSFSVEFEERCGYDWVKVVDDADSLMGADKLCGCSWSLPEPFNAAGNALVAKFHTDGSVRREGFVAEVISCPVGQFHDGIQCQTCTAVDRASCEASGLHFRECTPAHDAECLNAPNAPRETDKCWKFDSDGSGYASLGGSDYGSLGGSAYGSLGGSGYGYNSFGGSDYGSLGGSAYGSDDRDEGDCDIALQLAPGDSTVFASGRYGNRMDCTHVFSTSEGSLLSLRWYQFAVEFQRACNYDWVKVFSSPAEVAEAEKLCGCSDDVPAPYTSSSNSLIGMFHSDGSVSADGFVFEVVACAAGEFHDGIQCQTCTVVDRSACAESGLHFRQCTPAHDASCVEAPPAERKPARCMVADGSNYASFDGSDYDESNYGSFDGSAYDEDEDEDGNYGSLDGSAYDEDEGGDYGSLDGSDYDEDEDEDGHDYGSNFGSGYGSGGGISCVEVQTLEAGDIVEFSDGPGVYENDMLCAWYALPAEGVRLGLRFTEFAVEDGGEECSFDYVLAGSQDQDVENLTRFCGCSATLPPDVVGPVGQGVGVLLHTDGSVRFAGFTVSVVACPDGSYHDGSSCVECSAVTADSCTSPDADAFRACSPLADAACVSAAPARVGGYCMPVEDNDEDDEDGDEDGGSVVDGPEAVCRPCHSSCASCSGPRSDDCVDCAGGFTMAGGECVPCNAACRTCTGRGPAACTATDGVRDCAAGFTNAADESCVRCTRCREDEVQVSACTVAADTVCASCDAACDPNVGCVGAGPSACLACADGYFNDAGVCTSCSAPCGDGMYLVAACAGSADQVCGACHPTCETCSGFRYDQCVSCAEGSILDSGACVCDSAFFWDELSGKCSACDASCASCTEAGKCETCPSGARVGDDGLCMSCEGDVCGTTFKWWVSPFSECSDECGPDGTRTRFAICYALDFSSQSSDPDADCGAMPEGLVQPCNTDIECPQPYYVYGDWGSCSAVCGGGTSTRTAKCMLPALDGTVAEADMSVCAAALGGAQTSKTCNMASCHIVAIGPWSACSQPCGSEGVKTRATHCINVVSASIVDVADCIAELGVVASTPSTEATCNRFACPPKNKCDDADYCVAGACDAESETCTCFEGFEGERCDTPSWCPAGALLDSSNNCCVSRAVSDGLCCDGDNAVLDGNGDCCESGVVDACGVCDGTGVALDVNEVCCPAGGALDAAGVCCAAGNVDECGVCGGLSTCAIEVKAEVLLDDDPDALAASGGTDTMARALKSTLGLGEGWTIRVRFFQNNAPSLNGRRRMVSASYIMLVTIVPPVSPRPTLTEETVAALTTTQMPAQVSVVPNTAAPLPRRGICGNGVCENGERCAAGQTSGCCAADCPVRVQTCPTRDGTDKTAVCSNHGSCNANTGQCACAAGYTGEACATCTFGFMPDGAGGCKPAVTFLTDPCANGAVDPGEEGVDCGGPRCRACACTDQQFPIASIGACGDCSEACDGCNGSSDKACVACASGFAQASDGACSKDTDGDGVVDSTDNCVTVANESQRDVDENGVGDACDEEPKEDVVTIGGQEEEVAVAPADDEGLGTGAGIGIGAAGVGVVGLAVFGAYKMGTKDGSKRRRQKGKKQKPAAHDPNDLHAGVKHAGEVQATNPLWANRGGAPAAAGPAALPPPGPPPVGSVHAVGFAPQAAGGAQFVHANPMRGPPTGSATGVYV